MKISTKYKTELREDLPFLTFAKGQKKEPRSSDDMQEQENIQEKIKEKKTQTTILRHVFQALVLESGVNWAKDPELREFMTS